MSILKINCTARFAVQAPVGTTHVLLSFSGANEIKRQYFKVQYKGNEIDDNTPSELYEFHEDWILRNTTFKDMMFRINKQTQLLCEIV